MNQLGVYTVRRCAAAYQTSKRDVGRVEHAAHVVDSEAQAP